MLLKLGTRTLGEMLLVIALLAVAVPLPAWKNYEDSQAPTPVIRDQCTFSDGSTISFGQKALGGSESGHNVWQAGKYDATMLRVSGRTDVGIKMSAGTYTIFVLDKPEDRPDLWTLIDQHKDGPLGYELPRKTVRLGTHANGFQHPACNSFPQELYHWLSAEQRCANLHVDAIRHPRGVHQDDGTGQHRRKARVVVALAHGNVSSSSSVVQSLISQWSRRKVILRLGNTSLPEKPRRSRPARRPSSACGPRAHAGRTLPPPHSPRTSAKPMRARSGSHLPRRVRATG